MVESPSTGLTIVIPRLFKLHQSFVLTMVWQQVSGNRIVLFVYIMLLASFSSIPLVSSINIPGLGSYSSPIWCLNILVFSPYRGGP